MIVNIEFAINATRNRTVSLRDAIAGSNALTNAYNITNLVVVSAVGGSTISPGDDDDDDDDEDDEDEDEALNDAVSKATGFPIPAVVSIVVVLLLTCAVIIRCYRGGGAGVAVERVHIPRVNTKWGSSSPTGSPRGESLNSPIHRQQAPTPEHRHEFEVTIDAKELEAISPPN